MTTVGDKLTTSFSLPALQKLVEQKPHLLCSSHSSVSCQNPVGLRECGTLTGTWFNSNEFKKH